MKKFLINFINLLIVGFILSGCQTAEDVISPENELSLDKKTGCNTQLTPINTVAGQSTCVELVAAQNIVVGNVCIERVGNNLEVTYNITESGWTITETHLAVVGNPDNFPRTPNGNPKVGHFPYKGTHNNVTTVTYTVPLNNLPPKVYVAAHAVVENCNVTPSTNLCPEFPANATLTPTWLPSGYDYTVKVEFDSQTYFGFCVDNSRYIGSGGARTVNFICSYDPNLPNCSTFIEKPENLDLVNWIINNRQSNWNRAVVQAAIWKLINPSGNLTGWDTSTATTGEWRHDPVLREEIISLASQHEGFVPGCDQKVLVLVYGPGEICNPIRQVLAFEVPVQCVPGNCNSETAWGFPYNNGPIPGLSVKFGAQWARYFSYLR
jgi:hypothetical protein